MIVLLAILVHTAEEYGQNESHNKQNLNRDYGRLIVELLKYARNFLLLHENWYLEGMPIYFDMFNDMYLLFRFLDRVQLSVEYQNMHMLNLGYLSRQSMCG